MCLSCRQSARSFDFFGAPIGVTYKNESTFKTFLGGCVTIALAIFIGGNLILQILGVFISPTFSSTEDVSYFNYNGNTEGWTMASKDQTLAGGISLD